MKNEYEAPVAW